MAFQKFTRSESTEVLSPEQHKAAEDALKRIGKSSAQGLSKDERETLSTAVDRA